MITNGGAKREGLGTNPGLVVGKVSKLGVNVKVRVENKEHV